MKYYKGLSTFMFRWACLSNCDIKRKTYCFSNLLQQYYLRYKSILNKIHKLSLTLMLFLLKHMHFGKKSNKKIKNVVVNGTIIYILFLHSLFKMNTYFANSK